MNERQLPHSLDAEQSLLGVFIRYEGSYAEVGDRLTEDHFYSSKHKLIFKVIQDLCSYGTPVDLTTVGAELSMRGLMEQIGGRAYLVDLSETAISASNVGKYAEIVQELYSFRKLINYSSNITDSAYQMSESPDKLLGNLSTLSMELSSSDKKAHRFVKIGTFMTPAVEKLEKVQKGEIEAEIQFGFEKLDKIASCRKGELIIVAGRPSMGKTSFMNCCATIQAESGLKVGAFSAESNAEEWSFRALCTKAQLDSNKLRRGEIETEDWQKLTQAGSKLEGLDYWVDETPRIDIGTLAIKAAYHKKKHGLDILYVDYLQNLSTTIQVDRRQQVTFITRALKDVAKRLDIPVVVASQFGRDSDNRGRTWQDKRPKLSDLKESGDIEQEADVVIGLFRPDLFVKDTAKDKGKYADVAELLVLKQRNGPTGIIQLYFNQVFTRFENLGWNQSLDMF